MKVFTFLVVALCLLVGCTSSTKKLAQISLGISKEETISRIGSPTVVRGAVTNKFGQAVEVWEYRLAKPKTGKQIGAGLFFTVVTLGLASPVLLSEGEIQDYWLYFADGELVRWGQAGDWKAAANEIYEIRFNTGERLTK